MAASNPLEEILNSEVDESAISAVVGSLESSLLSPTIKASVQHNSEAPNRNNHTAVGSVTANRGAHELIVPGKPKNTASLHPNNANNKQSLRMTDANRSSPVMNLSSEGLVKASVGGNVNLRNHNGTPSTVGSTNVGTVATSRNSPIDSGNGVQSIAANQKPSMSTGDVKPVILPGQPPTVTVKSEPDVKPVLYKGMRPSAPQNIKQEVKYITHSPMNAVVSSGQKTSAMMPACTSVITLTRPMSSPQTVTVVRQPVAAGTTAASSSIQIVTMANSVMTPRAVTSSSVQKTLAPRTMPMQTTPVRIAANPQVLPARPQGNTNAITINQPIPPGMVLMRDPQGQLVMVQGQVPSTTAPVVSQPMRVQSVRLSSAPATQVIQPHPTQASSTVLHPHATASPGQMPIRQQASSGINRHPMIAPNVATSAPQQQQQQQQRQAPGMQPGAMAASLQQQQQQKKQDDLENVRKCKNFLSTLLRLAASQPPKTVGNVRTLIQGLIESRVDPENFTQQLQVELKSSPQPYLVPFLKKSLPLLRQSMISGKMKIDGIQAPPVQVLRQPPAPSPRMPTAIQARPTIQPSPIQFQGIRPGLPQQHRPTMANHPMVMMQQQQQQQQQLQQQQQQQRFPLNKQQAKAPSKMKPPLNAMAAAAQSKDKRKYDSLKDDDDINDVATMGGVNLTEESRNIMATSSDLLMGQMRSCKEEALLSSSALSARLTAIAKRQGLDDMSPDVVKLISHATEERLRFLLEKLAVVAEHRLEIYKMDKRYEVSKEVRPQIRFLEDLDRMEKKRHEEAERVVLLRAAKSRSKHEDPEHLKLKEKAKAMQQAELEQMRQREANLTALAAIGPRKKRKLDGPEGNAASPGASSAAAPGAFPAARPGVARPRIKRVNLRDLIFVLEQEREMNKSNLLYKTFMK